MDTNQDITSHYRNFRSKWLGFDYSASFRATYREPLLKGIKTVDATIKAWRKRIYELIREMLVVERLRQLDDVEQRTDTGVPGNFIETYSPILQWMRGPRLNSAAAARDEVIAEFGGDAGKLASEILRLRTAMRQAANALTQARAQGYYFSSALSRSSRQPIRLRRPRARSDRRGKKARAG